MAEEARDAFEYRLEHDRGQAFCLGIVAAAVIAIEQAYASSQRVFRPMTEQAG